MPVNVISSGILTTIQDLGRPGYYHLGIPMGGAMDRLAMRAANLLVGNEEGAAGLEAVFMGPELEFTEAATVAICGADLPDGFHDAAAEVYGALSGFKDTALPPSLDELIAALVAERTAEQTAQGSGGPR